MPFEEHIKDGSSEEAERAKMRNRGATIAGYNTDNAIAQRKEDNSSGNSNAGGTSDDSSNGGASSTGRDKEIGGGGKEAVLT
jgi:hypothetical protein